MAGRKQLPILGSSSNGPSGPSGGKRRLPVMQPRDPEEEEAYERPAWHWIVIGAVGSFLFFVLGLQLAQAFAQREITRMVGDGDRAVLLRETLTAGQEAYLSLVVYGLPLLCLLAASYFGGMLVGRFGGNAGQREATGSGTVTGVITSAIAATSMFPRGELFAWIAATVILLGVGALGGWRGGKRGLARRDRPLPDLPDGA